MATTARKVISAAIKKELEARGFYLKAARKVDDAGAAKLLQDLAREEARHEQLLRSGDVEDFLSTRPPMIEDLRIAEFLTTRKISPRSSFQDVLIFAMKREDASFWVYQSIAESTRNAKMRRLFRRLAEEERGHRNRLEVLYDDLIFNED